MPVLIQTEIHVLYQIRKYTNTFSECFTLQLKGITLVFPSGSPTLYILRRALLIPGPKALTQLPAVRLSLKSQRLIEQFVSNTRQAGIMCYS